MLKRININTKLDGYSRVIKATEVSVYLFDILTSSEFKDMIVNMDREYWMKGETGRFKNMTNTEIYKLLMTGQEEGSDLDYEVDLIIVGYLGMFWSKVVGYINPGNPEINVNYRFFDKMSKLKVCSNFAHEWAHQMGSRHGGDFYRLSFSYYMNNCIEKIYRKKFKGEHKVVDLTKICSRKWYRLWINKCTIFRR